MTEETTIPVPPGQQLMVSGAPAGQYINFPSWSEDGKLVAFTVRSAGTHTTGDACTTCMRVTLCCAGHAHHGAVPRTVAFAACMRAVCVRSASAGRCRRGARMPRLCLSGAVECISTSSDE